MNLSEQDKIDLEWMQSVNSKNIGLFFQAAKYAAIPTADKLVSLRLATKKRGYWITQKGKELLITLA